MSAQSPTKPQGVFPSTRWSMIGRVRHADISEKREAMGWLLSVYEPAIRAYLIGRRKVSFQEVDEVIQGFLTSQVLEKDLVAKAQKERGRFRSFLLTALNRYIASKIREETAQKRSPGVVVDITLADPPDSGSRPDQGFEIEWARIVIKRTVDNLREECLQSGRPDIWAVFEARLYLPIFQGQTPPSYAQLVSQYRIKSPSSASNLLVTAQRMFRRILRSVISQYAIHDSREIEEEIADLMNILSKTGSHHSARPCLASTSK